jgi:2-polyprenyl-3-methyl-5-hydroxy-6-metoxy-1,4-benzoquinol methylase
MVAEGVFYDRAARDFFAAADACPLDEWAPGSRARFALHPAGFPVFAPNALDSDEYERGDPYEAENSSAFQTCRRELTLELLQELERRRPLARVLDVGCGVGQITGLVASAFPAASVYGVDRSVSAIARAAEQRGAVQFAVADAYELPFAPESMDAVVCNNLWEHVPDPSRLLSELGRVLRRDGGLVVSTPSRYRLENLARVLQGKTVVLMSKHHVTEYTVGQMNELLGFGGFQIISRRSRVATPPLLTMKDRLLYRVISPLARGLLRAVNSHHDLASTVFFLALKG